MNKTSNTIAAICEIGMFAALGYVFDELQGIISKGLFINGGSIGFAMIAVLIVGLRRGWLPAILTGLIMGGLDIATSAYILHPAQLLLDYILPYAVVGIACLLKPFYEKAEGKKFKIMWLSLITIIGGLLKLLSHYLAGIIFWADPENFAWGLNNMNPHLYCFLYNFAFIGPSIVLTLAILIAVYLRAPRLLTAGKTTKVVVVEEKKPTTVKTKGDVISWIVNGIILVGCSFTFVFYLIKYIKSFGDYADGGAYGYDFDPDSMLISVVSFMIIILAVNAIVAFFKVKHSEKIFSGVLVTLLFISLVYCIARLIRMYVKGKDPTTYWIWFGIGLATLLLGVMLFIYRYLQSKNIKMGD